MGPLFWAFVCSKDSHLQTYASYLKILWKQTHISRLNDEDIIQTNNIIKRMLITGEGDILKHQVSRLLGRLQLLSFPKNNDELVSEESVIITGNWQAPHVKSQEPTKNRGFIKLLDLMYNS